MSDFPKAPERPDWHVVMKGCGGAQAEDNAYVTITLGTARLARSALRFQNSQDAYHNYVAAERELVLLIDNLPSDAGPVLIADKDAK